MGNNSNIIDTLWDFNNPAESEKRFRKLLNILRKKKAPKSQQIEVLTQIARSQGLQQKYNEAHTTLDNAMKMIKGFHKQPLVRYLLERGRVFNSSGEKNRAEELFLNALDFSIKHHQDYYAVDAAHMLGIVASGDISLKWNDHAIKLAEKSKDERTKKWLGALLNNTGWTYFDMGNYRKALTLFKKALKFRLKQNSENEIRIARWCIARTLRAVNSVDKALEMQKFILKEIEDKKAQHDGFVFEEIGECLLLKNKNAESKKYFKEAYKLLSEDTWLKKNENERLKRLKILSKG